MSTEAYKVKIESLCSPTARTSYPKTHSPARDSVMWVCTLLAFLLGMYVPGNSHTQLTVPGVYFSKRAHTLPMSLQLSIQSVEIFCISPYGSPMFPEWLCMNSKFGISSVSLIIRLLMDVWGVSTTKCKLQEMLRGNPHVRSYVLVLCTLCLPGKMPKNGVLGQKEQALKFS